MRVIVQAKFDVGFWWLVLMESGSDNSEEKDAATVTKDNGEPEEKRKRDLWWKEENLASLNKSLERYSNPMVYLVCGEGGF